MVRTRSSTKAENKNNKCELSKTMTVDQHVFDELKEELARINKQRVETEKENNTLRREISRLKELYNQIKESNICEGGSKIDVGLQTDEIRVAENQGNIINKNVIDQNMCGEIFGFNKISPSENEVNFNESRKSLDYLKRNCNNNNGCQNDKSDALVKGIMDYFQSLQVTIPLPKYDGIKRNPIEFMKELEKYLKKKILRKN